MGASLLLDGKAPQLEVLLHHYAYGKPKDTVEQTGPPQHISELVSVPAAHSGSMQSGAHTSVTFVNSVSGRRAKRCATLLAPGEQTLATDPKFLIKGR